MRTLAAAFLISMFPTVGHSECIYFRTSATLLKCEKVDPKADRTKELYPEATSDNSDLEEPGTRPLIRVRCECQYSLQGSNALCDQDQTIERTSTTGAENPEEVCRRGKSLCRETCPPRLP